MKIVNLFWIDKNEIVAVEMTKGLSISQLINRGKRSLA